MEKLTQTKSNSVFLPNRYDIHWYTIENVLGRGGFGITYLARDNNLDRPVAIKEYLPLQYCERNLDYTVNPNRGDDGKLYRWGLDRFLSEAQTLAKFDHANIVQVNSVFEKNNTAYMVMKFEQGLDLSTYLARTGQVRGQQTLLNMVLPILDGLEFVHEAGFIHRDIKPANIYIRLDSSPVLLDFGSARQSVSGQRGSMTRLISKSYTPFEQYNDTTGKQGAWTDIYSLGATLYFCVTAELPVDAMVRGVAIANGERDSYVKLCGAKWSGYSDQFLACIDWALEFRDNDRPQTCEQWAHSLLQSGTQDFDKASRATDITDVPLVLPLKPKKARTKSVKSEECIAKPKEASPSESRVRRSKYSHAKPASQILPLVVVLVAVVLLSIYGQYYLQKYSKGSVTESYSIVASDKLPPTTRITVPRQNQESNKASVLAKQQPQYESGASTIASEIIAAQTTAEKAIDEQRYPSNTSAELRVTSTRTPEVQTKEESGPETLVVVKPPAEDVVQSAEAVVTFDPVRLALLRQEQIGKNSREIIGNKLRKFIRALNKIDVPYLIDNSILNSRTKLKIDGMARIYKESEVTVQNVSVSQSEQSAYAELTINTLIAENGKMMVPGPAIGRYDLTISQIEGVWYDIAW